MENNHLRGKVASLPKALYMVEFIDTGCGEQQKDCFNSYVFRQIHEIKMSAACSTKTVGQEAKDICKWARYVVEVFSEVIHCWLLSETYR